MIKKLALGLFMVMLFVAAFETSYAAVTISGSGVTSDSSLNLSGVTTPVLNFGATTITFANASGTVITTGNLSAITSLSLTSATTTNLAITGLGSTGNPCLTVSSTGVVATTTCSSGGSGAISSSSAITANYFPFWATATGGLSGTSSIYENASGNIGIGTTTPAYVLTVIPSINSTSIPTASFGTGGSANSSSYISFDDRAQVGWDGTDAALGITAGSQKNIRINVNGTGNTLTSGMLSMFISGITPTVGYVGVNTSSPQSEFSVGGVSPQTTTSTLVDIGSGIISGGSASGTYLGINALSSYNGDVMNLQVGSNNVFRISQHSGTSSTVQIGNTGSTSCLEMAAASGTIGATIYVYFDSNGGIYATTTKPNFCL